MYPHRIRLRGPWEWELSTPGMPPADRRVETVAAGLPLPRRVQLPCRWGEGGLPDFGGRIRLRRRFGLPRQLDAEEKIWLTLVNVDGVVAVSLNGQLLGQAEQTAQPFEFEITGILRERNELVVEVEAPAGNRGLWGEVALEIRCSAFLRGVHAWPEFIESRVRVHVHGQVVGTSDRPLELYVLWGRSTIAYGTIRLTVSGQNFDLLSDELVPESLRRDPQVRIDLVNLATSWYALECPLEQMGEHTDA